MQSSGSVVDAKGANGEYIPDDQILVNQQDWLEKYTQHTAGDVKLKY